jgi:hypothetical protein
MGSLSDRILGVSSRQPGITDRWLAEDVFGLGTPQQGVNGECRLLADRGLLKRAKRPDGLIGNFIEIGTAIPPTLIVPPALPDQLRILAAAGQRVELELAPNPVIGYAHADALLRCGPGSISRSHRVRRAGSLRRLLTGKVA